MFQKVERRQTEFHRAMENQKLTPEEMEGIQCRSYGDFTNYWTKLCDEAESDFKAKQERGWWEWAKKCQDFASEVSSFMEDINPLLDIVKNAGPPWTGLAIGTIAALFVASARLSSNNF
jgi:hypothetical protein